MSSATATTAVATDAKTTKQPTIKIRYCRPCGLEEYAHKLEDLIRYLLPLAKFSFEYEPTDEEQDKGILIVSYEGTVVYSKKTHGQIKTEAQMNELVGRIQEATKAH